MDGWTSAINSENCSSFKSVRRKTRFETAVGGITVAAADKEEEADVEEIESSSTTIIDTGLALLADNATAAGFASNILTLVEAADEDEEEFLNFSLKQ